MYLNKILLLVLFSTTFISVHEAHNKKKQIPKQDTLTIDSIAINGVPTEQFMEVHNLEAEQNEPAEVVKEAVKKII